MTPLTINDIWGIQLAITDEIDAVCRAHGITYSLAYGSLLGAIRHKGFIPWDDDMDLMLMREDYENLVLHFNEWTNQDRFKLVSYRDKSSIYTFAKVIDTTTVVYEQFTGKRYPTSVWVDLFPLDYVDLDRLEIFKQINRTGLVRSFIVADSSVASTPFIKVVKKIICPFAHQLDPYKYAAKVDGLAKHATPSKTEHITDFLGCTDSGIYFSKDLLEQITYVPFEDRLYPVPKNPLEFLEVNYGDWQTPPPKDQRLIHTLEAYRV